MLKFAENKKINALMNKATKVEFETKSFERFFKVGKVKLKFVYAM